MAEQRMYVRTPEFARYAARIRHVTDLTSRLNVLPFADEDGRAALFAEIFGRPLPDNVTIYPPFFTEYGLGTEFAEQVFVNQGCTFMDEGGIRLGKGVMIGPKANLITGGHPVVLAERREFIVTAPIVLEENVWLGAASTVLPGVTIGRNSVVGAGTVVSRDVPPDTLVTGPTAVVRKRLN
ncbi:sugar O-acetyltransferase [Catenuloplanes japonicus]|uniref:sugar O-acetyltransferase n=1 Tax=Catenuloplanes japonicus TaxID=33876 RepID=UPI0018DDF108|nr:sugar O-acetyltransferase [Catenuloplanes japonicus]